MIRFFIFYIIVVHYRVARMLIREAIDGDNNYLSSPLLTMNRILSHPLVKGKGCFVDVGCGEGLVALMMRLFHHKKVVCCDTQRHYLKMINVVRSILLISKVNCSSNLPYFDHDDVVFLCVWTSWSKLNRQRMISQFLSHIPKGGILVTISHGIRCSEFQEIHSTVDQFAWGNASVYYYQHI
ncbi:MAG: class I SAM-dependent methyltransferase [Candidatus Margulisiibacteriota bacterium]